MNAHVCNKCAGKMKGKKGKPAPEEEDEEEMTGNMTDEEWFNSAPPGVAAVVANAMKLANDEKAKIIEQLTVNLSGPAKKQAVMIYANNTLDELKVLAPSVVNNAQPRVMVPGPQRNFTGAASPGRVTTNKNKSESEPLIPPTINWAEAAKEFAGQN